MSKTRRRKKLQERSRTKKPSRSKSVLIIRRLQPDAAEVQFALLLGYGVLLECFVSREDLSACVSRRVKDFI